MRARAPLFLRLLAAPAYCGVLTTLPAPVRITWCARPFPPTHSALTASAPCSTSPLLQHDNSPRAFRLAPRAFATARRCAFPARFSVSDEGEHGVLAVEKRPDPTVKGQDGVAAVLGLVQAQRAEGEQRGQQRVAGDHDLWPEAHGWLQPHPHGPHIVGHQQAHRHEGHEGDAHARGKRLDVVGAVALHVWQVLGDGNDHREQSDE
mmetsp:Transcript_20270/g.51305  ORF Transcript_20270/g.51305 Transcript_20270/m.51305 type:complete len:206 (-) Transcript_20270:809-1426(-)